MGLTITAAEAELRGPLARLSDMCDEMNLHLDPGRQWYPEVEIALRRLDYAIRWEMDRLRWEIKFATESKREEAAKARSARRARKALRAPAQIMAEPSE